MLEIISFIGTIVQIIKEESAKEIPSEYWKNQDLISKDISSGISSKKIRRNLANGKYKMDMQYAEPHKDKNGKVIIENCEQYDKDMKTYGITQTMMWVRQGKYNLTPEELRKEDERIKKKLESLYNY